MQNTTYILTEITRDEHSFPDKTSLIQYLGCLPDITPNPENYREPEPYEYLAPEDTLDSDLVHTGMIIALLEDPRFTLRTVTSLEDKTGLPLFKILTLLDQHGTQVVTRTNRSTGEQLIGLASRN